MAEGGWGPCPSPRANEAKHADARFWGDEHKPGRQIGRHPQRDTWVHEGADQNT